MSKLIVMPGSKAFKETTKGIELETAVRPGRVLEFVGTPKAVSGTPVQGGAENLRGRTLMLNLTVCRGFQCGGFMLGMNRPFGVVDDNAQVEPIRQALADGRLTDITGQDPKTGFKTRDGSVSKVSQEDTGLRAFVGRNDKGELYVAIPKNKTQAKKFEREIKRTGTLVTQDLEEAASGLSGITTEDVPLDAQGRLILTDPTPIRGQISVRTPRRQRKPRRG